MENNIKNIELINKYIDKLLSENEIKNFENRLKTDANFKEEYEAQALFLEGLKRQQLKSEIVKAKQTYIKVKWMKFFGVSFVALTILVIVYVLISNQSSTPVQNNNHELNKVLTDTVPAKNAVQTSLDSNDTILIKDIVISKNKMLSAESVKSVNNFGISFLKAPQKLKINTEKDTIVVCKEGTRLDIKANSFINKNGNLIKGEIDLNVTEYYKLSDMLLANLTTTSDREQLETGGMLNIEAFKGEDFLKLKKGIEISFPSANKKEGMQIFSGDWKDNNVNWKLQKDSFDEATVEEVVIEDIEEDIDVPFSIIENVPIFPGCENVNNARRRDCMSKEISNFVSRKFNTGLANNIGLTGRQRISIIFKINKKGDVVSIQSRAIHPILEEEAKRVIGLLPKMIPGKQRGKAVNVPYSLPIIFTITDAVEVNLSIGEVNSTSLNNQVEYDTLYTKVRGEIEQIREVMHDKNLKVDSTFMKTWNTYITKRQIRFLGVNNENRTVVLRKPLFEMENAKFKVLEDDSITRGGHIIRKVWNDSLIPTTSVIMRLVPKPKISVGGELVTEETLKKRLANANANKTISTKTINSYALQVLSLGWINLDRFVKKGNTINYKIKVKNRDGRAKVSMIFKSLSSILPSRNINGHFSFGKVNKDEGVTLVAIKKQKGKLYLDIIDTTTKVNPDVEFDFKEVSLDEMINELERLNEMF